MRKLSKRISAVFIALMMLFVMTACGDNGNNGQAGNDAQNPATAQQPVNSGADNSGSGNTKAETVTLQLSLESDKNAVFSKYDMNVYFDGKLLSTLKNGEKYSTQLDVSKGSHELKFTKADDESLNGVETITLENSKAISYFVKHDRNSIDISRTETKDIVDDKGKNETTVSVTEEPTTEKATEAPTTMAPTTLAPTTEEPTTEETTTEAETEEPTTEAETEEPTTEAVTEEPTTEEETEEPTTEAVTEVPTTAASNNGIPVMSGSNLKSFVNACKSHGIKQIFDEQDFGHGTYDLDYCNSNQTITVDIIYYKKTKEILTARVMEWSASGDTTYSVLKDLAKFLCPAESASKVSDWVNANAGVDHASTEIDGFDYEIYINNGTIIFTSGYSTWEKWELSLE